MRTRNLFKRKIGGSLFLGILPRFHKGITHDEVLTALNNFAWVDSNKEEHILRVVALYGETNEEFTYIGQWQDDNPVRFFYFGVSKKTGKISTSGPPVDYNSVSEYLDTPMRKEREVAIANV